MHEWERISSLPSKEKLEKAWRILEEKVWSEKESVWEMNSREQIERDRRNERRIAMEKYIDPSVMLDSWGIERYWGSCRGRCWGTGCQQLRYRVGIKQQRIRFKNRSSIDPAGVEELSRMQELSQSIHQVSRRCWVAFKKNAWEAQQIARYRGGVEPAFQNSFSRCESTDMYAIQHTTQPMIQSTQKSLKIVSQFKNFEHKDLQNTHTHTTSLTNFIFQK